MTKTILKTLHSVPGPFWKIILELPLSEGGGLQINPPGPWATPLRRIVYGIAIIKLTKSWFPTKLQTHLSKILQILSSPFQTHKHFAQRVLKISWSVYIFPAVIINNKRRLLLIIPERQTTRSKRAMTTVAVTRGERGLDFVLTWPREVAKSNQTR